MNAVTSSQQIESWYESFRPLFINMGLKLGYKKDELSDIISQLFLDLLEKNIDTHTIDNPRAYLSTAFRRKLVDYHRSVIKNRFVDEEKILAEYSEPSVQDRLQQVQANTELIDQIRTAYRKLPNRCQKVIYLKFYKGLTTDQIAQQTGLSKRTVYNNLFEGVKMLRHELNQQLPSIQIASLLSLLPLAASLTIF
jgi:RNA polymerase sigma factor (sigma-70 family)